MGRDVVTNSFFKAIGSGIPLILAYTLATNQVKFKRTCTVLWGRTGVREDVIQLGRLFRNISRSLLSHI